MAATLTEIFSQAVKTFLEKQGLTRYPETLLLREKPNNPEHGDYASAAPLQLAKLLKRSPLSIAKELVATIETTFAESTPSLLAAVSVAPPGFINLMLQQDYFQEAFLAMLRGPVIPPPPKKMGKKMLLEYVSANPTGPLHVGHGRWAVIGDVLANLLTAAGYSVSREYYVNDMGRQIKLFVDSILATMGLIPFPEEGYRGNYITTLANRLREQLKSFTFPQDWKKARDVILETALADQQKTLTALGVSFDRYFHEAELHANNCLEKTLQQLEAQGFLYDQEGAKWFKSTAFGDDKDRVLIRGNQDPTYFLADLAYHLDKVIRGFGHFINIFGADHHGYVGRLQAGLAALFPPASRPTLEILIGQLVSLYRKGEPVRMSKRTGELITLDEVMEEIGKDATRFFFTLRSPNTHLDFDLALAKEKSLDNPVYYVQYAHARICSIIRELKEKDPRLAPLLQRETQAWIQKDMLAPFQENEQALLKKLLSYPEEIEAAAEARAPPTTLFAKCG